MEMECESPSARGAQLVRENNTMSCMPTCPASPPHTLIHFEFCFCADETRPGSRFVSLHGNLLPAARRATLPTVRMPQCLQHIMCHMYSSMYSSTKQRTVSSFKP